MKGLWRELDSPDDPNEPSYDPIHLGAVLVLTLLAIGALYWALWTMLVYEGGLFAKIGPAFEVLLRRKSLADFGYKGPWNRGVFEGWLGNLGGFAACVAGLAAARRSYVAARSRARKLAA